MRLDNKNFRHDYFFKGLTAFLVIAACVLFAFLVFKIDVILKGIETVLSVLKPVIFGLAIAYLVDPIVKFFDNYVSKVTRYKAKNLIDINGT